MIRASFLQGKECCGFLGSVECVHARSSYSLERMRGIRSLGCGEAGCRYARSIILQLQVEDINYFFLFLYKIPMNLWNTQTI